MQIQFTDEEFCTLEQAFDMAAPSPDDDPPHLTKGTIVLSCKDVPGFVRRVRKLKNGQVDLARLMAEFRAQCEPRLSDPEV